MIKKRDESKEPALETPAKQLFRVHLTESLAAGMTKQFREESNERLQFLEPIRDKRRGAWLNKIESELRKAFPGELLLAMVRAGKGKDRELSMFGLKPEGSDWVVFGVYAMARNFELGPFPMNILFTKHVIERLFLRLATTSRGKVAKAIRPVADFLVLNYPTLLGAEATLGELQLLTDTGRFTVEVKQEIESQALSLVVITFLYHSQLTTSQRRKFEDAEQFSTERTQYVDIRLTQGTIEPWGYWVDNT